MYDLLKFYSYNTWKFFAKFTYHDKLTQLENGGEFTAHAVLQMFGFSLRHLPTAEVKDFFTETTNVYKIYQQTN